MQCLCTYVWNIKLYWGYVSHLYHFCCTWKPKLHSMIKFSSHRKYHHFLRFLVTRPPWPRWLGSPAPTLERYLFRSEVGVLGLINVYEVSLLRLLTASASRLKSNNDEMMTSKCKLTLTSRCQISPSRRWSCWCSPWWRSRRSTCTLC